MSVLRLPAHSDLASAQRLVECALHELQRDEERVDEASCADLRSLELSPTARASDRVTMNLSETRRARKIGAEATAAKVRAKYGLSTPVDLISLSTRLNIQVCVSEKLPKGVLGFLMSKQGVHKIFVNASSSFRRQRFTIALELGHFFLHATPSGLFVHAAQAAAVKEPVDPRLVEANSFAASLLMPRAEVEAMVAKLELPPDPFDETWMAQAADVFDVSPLLMLWRLQELGLSWTA